MNDSGMNSSSADSADGSSADAPTVANMYDLVKGLSGSPDSASGKKSPQEPGFGFSHHGFNFTAKALRQENGEAQLSLCCSIGFLPYSAQSGFARRCALYLIDEKHRPAPGRFPVQPNKRILFLAETGISPDMGHEAVIAGRRRILFDTRPHFDPMAECLAFAPFSKVPARSPPLLPANRILSLSYPPPEDPPAGDSGEDSGEQNAEMTAAPSEEKPAARKKPP